ncbi:hypothetical protein [uncultured Aliivibrio sp.]|uniref:hypothetical protein n=1 Tax=uncultured Aliivibrio sp. TaxID=873085 RepID=UPI00260C8DF0|nr:hypothetical protein [uncultured Aliivibrio sp.]
MKVSIRLQVNPIWMAQSPYFQVSNMALSTEATKVELLKELKEKGFVTKGDSAGSYKIT